MESKNNSTGLGWFTRCIYTKLGLYIAPSFIVVWSFLVFPLYVLVLSTSFQRWRQNKGFTVSHTDFFTFHTFVFELLIFCSYTILAHGSRQSNVQLMDYSLDLFTFGFFGLMSLQVLTCFERYLAVVHPVVYLKSRNQRWIWARNVVILAVWVFGLSWMWVLRFAQLQNTYIVYASMLGTTAIVIIFCTVQVLHSLRNPSPSEGHGVSQTKQKAFHTMLAILVVLLLWFAEGAVAFVLENLNLGFDVLCNFQMSACWFELPSSLVLPLLFLNRAGKLPKCRGKTRKKTLRQCQND